MARGRDRGAWFITLLLVATACAGGPESPPQVGEPGSEVLACQVTDETGIEDGGFNQVVHEGLEASKAELGVAVDLLESKAPSDYEPNLVALVKRECDIIISSSPALAEVTKVVAEANPGQKFAIVEFEYSPPIEGVLSLTFEAGEAAFLAGYLAAGVTTTGKVGTFGSVNLPSITELMGAFGAGVEYRNQEQGSKVELIGWGPAKRDVLFSEGLGRGAGRRTAQVLIEAGADVLFPVVGPDQQVAIGAATAVREVPEVKLIWTEGDGCALAPSLCDLILTSVIKNVDMAVMEAVTAVMEDRFAGGSRAYVGTLGNGGVSIAPFRAFEDLVPLELKSELELVRWGLINGSISLEARE